MLGLISVNKSLSLLAIAILSVLLLYFHLIAEENYYYWIYWWYDIPMHGLGGFVIGLLAIWIVVNHPFSFANSSLRQFGVAITVVLAIGIFWEIFEFGIGDYQYEIFNSYVLDTVLDVCMDLAGGLGAFLLRRHLHG